MTIMAGFLALAVDGGRLFLSRRAMQAAADGGALAGAQDLVGTVTSPSGSPADSLYNGVKLALAPFGLLPTHPKGDPFYVSPPGNTVSDTVGGYTVTVNSPTGYNNKRVTVSLARTVGTSFAALLGFSSVQVTASATAEAGTNAKSYALFAYAVGGSGNTINDDQNGYALIDNAQDGADVCAADRSGQVWSNAKFHVPNPTQAYLNVNGDVTVNSASDNHGLLTYWVQGVPFGTGVDPKPDYLVPDTSGLVLAPSRTVIAAHSPATIAPDTFDNDSSYAWYVYHPGKYTTAVTIPAAGDDPNSTYIFQNGLYYFTGVSLTITGATVGNTSDGKPKYSGKDGTTNLKPDPGTGTNGVEFIMDGTSTFAASNTSSPGGGSIFLVAPTYTPTGSTGIAFFIPATNTLGTTVWSETVSATTSNNPRFQIWGTVFDASASSMTLTGVQKGPHNLAPSSLDSSGQFAINGEFIGYTISLQNGNVLGNTTGSPATCPGGIAPGTPALLIQYNSRFAPKPGVNSYLVQ
jgi:hypothetical protein